MKSVRRFSVWNCCVRSNFVKFSDDFVQQSQTFDTIVICVWLNVKFLEIRNRCEHNDNVIVTFMIKTLCLCFDSKRRKKNIFKFDQGSLIDKLGSCFPWWWFLQRVSEEYFPEVTDWSCWPFQLRVFRFEIWSSIEDLIFSYIQSERNEISALGKLIKTFK